MHPASLITLISTICSRTCFDGIEHITTSTCFTAPTRLFSSSNDPWRKSQTKIQKQPKKKRRNIYTNKTKQEEEVTFMSVAPQLDKDWSFCALTGSLGAESLTRTKVGCENFRLNCAKWHPKFPVAPIISTLLFFSSMFFFFP